SYDMTKRRPGVVSPRRFPSQGVREKEREWEDAEYELRLGSRQEQWICRKRRQVACAWSHV
ncbi:hypothetical protein RUM43_005651, partial [Polyplax serrata]